MPHSFFILYRLFLRVDHVLFRMYDIRLYHKFGTSEVIRETIGVEADYDTIKGVSLYSSHLHICAEADITETG
jgi:type 2A phosphatase activator TIP41